MKDEYQPVQIQDYNHMESTYANLVEVTVSGECINLLFRVEQARQAGEDDIKSPLVKVVSLSPSVAKRLALDLSNALRDHEAIGSSRPPVPSDCAEAPKGTVVADRALPGHGNVDKILTLLRGMGMVDSLVDLEYSFKVANDNLFENRLLLGIERGEEHAQLDKALATICEIIGMPHNMLKTFMEGLPAANHVYFGAEKDAQALVFKAYLEFRDEIERQIAGADVCGRSFPLFTGFKWDTSAPARQAVTRYDWFPSLPVQEILVRLGIILDPSRHAEALETCRGVVEKAAELISHRDIQYLEVAEVGNPRWSFDINLYKSGLRLEDIFPHLLSALRRYGIRNERYEPLYQRIKTEKLGHLAGGVDRENRDFMTIYYGATKVHSSMLASADRASTHGG